MTLEVYETAAARESTSYASLTPLSFLERSALVWASRTAVREGECSWTYAEHADRVRRIARALREQVGVADGDRVAVILPNVHSLLELHYAVPGAGAILVPLNTRLAAPEYEYILRHSGASVLIATVRLRDELDDALRGHRSDGIRTIWVDEGNPAACEYEALIDGSDQGPLGLPADEQKVLSINYTSGTTGRPKGVMTSHRGAYLHSLGVIAEANLEPSSAYLWTLPMFHCNGWAYTWAVTAAGAAHACLPKVEPAAVWSAIARGGITHFCAAPTVLTMLFEDDAAAPSPAPVRVFVGGSPPNPTLLARAAALNFQVTHLYGLTETYGPLAVCSWNPDWDELSGEEQARLRARQGVASVVSERIRVVDPDMNDVPPDGASLGEVVMRGNNVMLGYYRDPEATAAAFRGGWFHSGDIAVMHPDGYFELRDRLKDIVISGGENVATVEVEQALAAHASVSEVAVVGVPDPRWGEAVVACVVLARGAELVPDEVIAFARTRLAGFKVPKRVVAFDAFPKTGTGKIQKFRLREQIRQQTTPA